MRKIKLFIFIAFLSFSGLSAQTVLLEPAQLHIGVTQGITGSMVVFIPNIVDMDILWGYNGGIVGRYVTEKGKGLQVELNFYQRGWKEKKGKNQINPYAQRLNYIEMPILAHFYLGNKSRFFFNLGPKIGYLVSHKRLTDDSIDPNAYQHNNKIKNYFDYGVAAGLGYQFTTPRHSFFIEARAGFSLQPIFKTLPQAGSKFNYTNSFDVAANFGWLLRVR